MSKEHACSGGEEVKPDLYHQICLQSQVNTRSARTYFSMQIAGAGGTLSLFITCVFVFVFVNEDGLLAQNKADM